MTIAFNHTIVAAPDKREAATFLTELFGLPDAKPFGPFLAVELANGASLDYLDAQRSQIRPQHYAFLVSDDEFTSIYDRITQRGLAHWADAAFTQPGEINHLNDGRGVYFDDPAGHHMEIITRPYPHWFSGPTE